MQGKIVLITGATAGIGAKTAVHFASLGCKLVITGRNTDELQKTFNKCIQTGLRDEDVLPIKADLQKEEDIRKIMDNTIAKFGELHVLVNNAGVYRGGGITDTSLADYDLNFTVNVRAAFYLTQLAVPFLEKTKGNVVNISSVVSTKTLPLTTPFVMSKAAIDSFTKMASVELAPKNIRVNSVNPGCIDNHDNEERAATWSRRCPLGRLGKVMEVVKAVAFLADEDSSSFITGTHLIVDGGLQHAWKD